MYTLWTFKFAAFTNIEPMDNGRNFIEASLMWPYTYTWKTKNVPKEQLHLHLANANCPWLGPYIIFALWMVLWMVLWILTQPREVQTCQILTPKMITIKIEIITSIHSNTRFCSVHYKHGVALNFQWTRCPIYIVKLLRPLKLK